ncbi:hypothetical protein FQB35_10440 [Crassaminicella thermophila]|uniref:Uncharacterized protein n=1 Tax=Crassaminicella thermophila TaxID=2599308 RepID=A0A5C0SG47_CRATE|nr:hypothetical protein [Crassaminicella thermophila]QEK12716.1 hypothetical protein FQB35_10440 [Crassaminicella thermophila]
MSKLANLRKGIQEHKIIDFPDTDMKVALVQLSTKEIIEAREKAIKYITKHHVDVDTGDLILNTYILLKAMRNAENLEEPFADSFEEIQENTNPKQIYALHSEFLEVQNGKLPEIEDMTNEEFEEIKKKLNQTQLKELDGELQNILRYFHQKMLLKSLQKGN